MSTPIATVAGKPVDLDRLARICLRFGVVELALFGSAARGTATGSSDVDVLYALAPEARLGFSINRLEDELAKVFGRPVDLGSKRVLHPLLRDEVLSDARVLYAA